jgi:hypothetical protein
MPEGNLFSIIFIGGGFSISNIRKRIKPKHMLKKGWMRYEIVKQFNFDAHGDFDLTSQKFTPFSNCKDECVDVCNDLTKVLKDVLKEIKNEKF